jgi:hypothetical protein
MRQVVKSKEQDSGHTAPAYFDAHKQTNAYCHKASNVEHVNGGNEWIARKPAKKRLKNGSAEQVSFGCPLWIVGFYNAFVQKVPANKDAQHY